MAPNSFLPDMFKMESKHLDGNNYRRWAECILFEFTQIEIAYALLMESKDAESTVIEIIVIESDDVVKEGSMKE